VGDDVTAAQQTSTLDDLRELVAKGDVKRVADPSGVVRYSLSGGASRAMPAAAPARVSWAVSERNAERREQILSIMRGLPVPSTKRAITNASEDVFTAKQVGHFLVLLETEGRVRRASKGATSPIHWFVIDEPGEKIDTSEPLSPAPVAASADCSPSEAPIGVSDAAAQETHKPTAGDESHGCAHPVRAVASPEAAPEPVTSKPAVGSYIPFGLFDRVEAISADIEDALGDAFDVDDVPRPALKALAAASGAVHRALRALYIEAKL
jgi:hypothetical protein